MIKKSVFEEELIFGMQRELQAHDKRQGMSNLVKAAENLHSAMEILEEAGLSAQANKVFKILEKIACDEHDAKTPHKPKNPTHVSDRHTKGLTSEKMVKNLSHHGTVFNLADAPDLDVNLKEIAKDITDKGGAFNMAFNVSEDQKADDLLNADIGEEPLEVSEPNPEKTFEDSD